MPQKQVVLKNCKIIDPKDINTFIENDGFKALSKAMEEMSPEDVINEIKDSGLRGRGGAGFPTGLKLEFTRKSPEEEKFIICNADEGEVGTFKDRYIIEHDPFSLIEGIAIAGYAIGSSKGYVYLRGEYFSRLFDILKNAIDQAKAKKLLNIDIEIQVGAGAYVCGEETALIESIEGKRGDVRYRPPFPPSEGLWSKPTSVNNVETLMNLPFIILNGADCFSAMGTEDSKGTKVFSVSGDVRKPGVYELEMGSSLRELIEEFAQAEDVQMMQIGGASGRVVPYDMVDTALSFETVLGAGGVIVFNRSRDVIELARRTMDFFEEESCGKCAPCREGTKRMVEIIQRLENHRGRKKDLKLIEELAETMMLASLCGLGQAAPNFVVDTLKQYRDEYESRINDFGFRI